MSDLDCGPPVDQACPQCTARLRGTPQWCPRCYLDLRPAVTAAPEPGGHTSTERTGRPVMEGASVVTPADPELADPELAGPETAEPEPAEPETVNPEVARLLGTLAEQEAAQRPKVAAGGRLGSMPPAALAGAGGLLLAVLGVLALSGVGAVLGAR